MFAGMRQVCFTKTFSRGTGEKRLFSVFFAVCGVSADATENSAVTVSIVRKIGSSMTGLIKFQSVKRPKVRYRFRLGTFSHDAGGSHYKNPSLSWRL